MCNVFHKLLNPAVVIMILISSLDFQVKSRACFGLLKIMVFVQTNNTDITKLMMNLTLFKLKGNGKVYYHTSKSEILNDNKI